MATVATFNPAYFRLQCHPPSFSCVGKICTHSISDLVLKAMTKPVAFRILLIHPAIPTFQQGLIFLVFHGMTHLDKLSTEPSKQTLRDPVSGYSVTADRYVHL